ncbi:MAG: apolipoprotein N-acyltransferase, partial [Spirochaetota bacterium]
MRSFRLYLLGISSALLFALGLPNELFLMGFPLLGYVALIPLYFALLEIPDWKQAVLVTGLYGALHHAVSSYWLYFFKDFAFWTIGVSTLAYFVVYSLLGLCLVFLLRRAGPARPLAFALLWTSFEFLKSIGFLGYPWGLLPYTQSNFLPMLQIADITGVYGISFILAFSNAILAECLYLGSDLRGIDIRSWGRIRVDFQKRRGAKRAKIRCRLNQPLSLRLPVGSVPRYAALGLLLVAANLGYGYWRIGTKLPDKGSLLTLIVQQNLNPWSEGTEAALEANMSLMKKALAAPGPRPELVLFSESSLGYPYLDSQNWYAKNPRSDPFIPYFKQQGFWLLTGSPIVLDWKNFSATNSVILLDPTGRVTADYAKIHPVPFAEAIPFYEYAWFRDFLKKAVGLEAGWTLGSKYTLFAMPTLAGTLRFGAPICFEDAFAGLCRRFILDGADILVNLTDDSWSKTQSAEYQHFSAARFRAIEARRSLVRSTNSWISAVIGPYGEVRASLPPFVAASATVQVPLVSSPRTFYIAFGDWFALLALLLSFSWTLILVAG